MTDLAIKPAYARQTMTQQIANRVSGWPKRLPALRPASQSACPPAPELAGIIRIDRYDIAPWLAF